MPDQRAADAFIPHLAGTLFIPHIPPLHCTHTLLLASPSSSCSHHSHTGLPQPGYCHPYLCPGCICLHFPAHSPITTTTCPQWPPCTSHIPQPHHTHVSPSLSSPQGGASQLPRCARWPVYRSLTTRDFAASARRPGSTSGTCCLIFRQRCPLRFDARLPNGISACTRTWINHVTRY